MEREGISAMVELVRNEKTGRGLGPAYTLIKTGK